MIEGAGQCALRGGIIDVYPPTGTALRLEFFDDEVDSLRSLDPLTQRSLERMEKAVILPASDMLTLPEERIVAASALRQDIKNAAPKTRARYLPLLESIEAGAHGDDMEMAAYYLFPGKSALPGYLNAPIWLVDDISRAHEHIDNYLLEFAEKVSSALEESNALPSQERLIYRWPDVLGMMPEGDIVALSSLLTKQDDIKPHRLLTIEGRACPQYHGQFRMLISDIRQMQKEKQRVLLLAGGPSRGHRLAGSLAAEELSAPYIDAYAPLEKGTARVLPLSQSRGFSYPSIGVTVIADGDIYGQMHRKRQGKSRAVDKMGTFTDLNPGDYVVHETHGIAKYLGTIRLQVEGTFRDYLHLEYAGGDKLYVPTDQMRRVQKYIGGDGYSPRLSNLSGTGWNRQKSKVKSSIKDIADDLIKLYARRQSQSGFAFSPDTPWQREFEDAFPYEETPDQLQAIGEIKENMESSTVMDRLLCGDVGYGKTEVALRAAFKAIMDGKQIALLAPTTILVQQHEKTARERFKGYPVRVESLSRFKTAREQKEILNELKAGNVDFVTGTHRLLGKDVQFKNLGLLIVDEEQRFGVAHKEKIKQLRENVDVLTLSATPIPRTLHMSLTGIRDMSILETPPEERFPIQTYVVEYSESLVRDAILRELGRGGQVFYLFNRVDRIEAFHQRLSNLVPEARIAVGHGQMPERMLENIMMDFYDGEFDVLLCTTIIESGLDVPLANTLIVQDADRFGLSQLYQLRGRVGRSNRLAYAYLTINEGKVLTEDAEKRLRAIREFTDFGSGFRIAMRDLEIRGAGNLLGAEQHGYMSTVGYDLYCKLIEETVRELKGEFIPEDIELRIDIPIDAYLPEDYVPTSELRMEMYKRIASIETREDAGDVLDELLDRFGDPAEEVLSLIDIALTRAALKKLGIESMTLQKGQFVMRFSTKANLDPAALVGAISEHNKKILLRAGGKPALVTRVPGEDVQKMLKETLPVIEDIARQIADTAI